MKINGSIVKIIPIILFVACVSLLTLSLSAYADTDGAKKMLQDKQVTNNAQLGVLYQLQMQDQSIKYRQKQIEDQANRLQRQQALVAQAINILQKRQQNTQLVWQKVTSGNVPKNAIIAGYNINGAVKICQAYYAKNSLHPGQLTSKGCVITYGGGSYLKKDYFVLSGKSNVTWQPATIIPRGVMCAKWPATIKNDSGRTVKNISEKHILRYPCGPILPRKNLGSPQSYASIVTPIIGGHENNNPLYICRGIYNDNIHVGKVIQSACNIAVENKEQRITTYEVLAN